MTVHVYRNTDPGAPKRTGALGADAAILKACLVTGYGSKGGAGWSNPFSATNVEVFRQGGGNQRFLRVDDSLQSYPHGVFFKGFESMTGPSTGVAPMPSSGVGLAIARSTGGEMATDRPWTIVATDKFFYFYAAVYNVENERAYPQMMCYGDFNSFVPGDQYNTILIGNASDSGYSGTQAIAQSSGNINNALAYHLLGRKFDQLGGPIVAAKQADYAKLGTTQLGNGYMQYPNPADGGFYMSPIWITEPAGTSFGCLRGIMPGMWTHCHPVQTVKPHDTIAGTGDMTGKTIEFFCFGSNASDGGVGIEISDTW